MIKDTLHDPDDYPLATDDFAAKNFVKPQSVRKRFAATGSYHGVRPRKLKNRRLAWPDVQV
ncbi:hypothetical protein PQR14_13220 [Paraburkholderia bryophila]|jgi:hypothetical protein|uniref:hypothetical protein n=1 Tax=Paraburkholderia bryophila TaxID=420952 RepID=UPI0038BD7610